VPPAAAAAARNPLHLQSRGAINPLLGPTFKCDLAPKRKNRTSP
jgi:hypothetical protein